MLSGNCCIRPSAFCIVSVLLLAFGPSGLAVPKQYDGELKDSGLLDELVPISGKKR